MKAETLLKLAPIDWEKTVDKLKENQRDELRREMGEIAKRAAMLEGYLDERHGYGCGDQGHEKAIKRANRNGKMLWMKVLGYNAFYDRSI